MASGWQYLVRRHPWLFERAAVFQKLKGPKGVICNVTMFVNESRHMRIIWCLRVKIIRSLREQEMFSMQSVSEVTDLFLKLPPLLKE